MSDNFIRVPARSLKEQFSRGSEAWKEQSDPIFQFWAEGDWWGLPFFSLSASRYFGGKETLCLYWPLGTVVITGPKVLDFYVAFSAHRASCLKADGKDITSLKLILNGDSNAEDEAGSRRSNEPVIRSIAQTLSSLFQAALRPRTPGKLSRSSTIFRYIGSSQFVYFFAERRQQ